jgi:hypothetical protein
MVNRERREPETVNRKTVTRGFSRRGFHFTVHYSPFLDERLRGYNQRQPYYGSKLPSQANNTNGRIEFNLWECALGTRNLKIELCTPVIVVEAYR